MIRFYSMLTLVLISVQFLTAQTAFDAKLQELAEKVAVQIAQQGKAKVAVWDFINTQGEITNGGKFIAEDFSVYFTNASKGTYQVMDRNHLDQILKEHKLNAEGFIDPETAKELGRLKAVDAIITGTVDILDTQLKVRVKVLDTETALQIAAEIGYLPIDANMASFLGVPGMGTQSSGAANRGFNNPINSNEGYNNPETVNKACESNNTGDYCFSNTTKDNFIVSINANGTALQLPPGQTQCLYNMTAGSYNYHVMGGRDYGRGQARIYRVSDAFIYVHDQGQLLVEKCKSKSFVIK